MNKALRWQISLAIFAILLSVLYIIPSTSPTLPSWWGKLFPTNKIHLGLDLKGGIHLVLEAETKKALDSYMEGVVEELRREFRSEKIRFETLKTRPDGSVELILADPKHTPKIKELLQKRYGDLTFSLTTMEAGKEQFIIKLSSEAEARFKENTVEQALETIRNRIDQFGVAEAEIRRQEEEKILVQLPGIDDPERAKEIIGKTALLEFKLVDDQNSLDEALKGNIPPGSMILYHTSKDPKTGQVSKIPYLLKKKTLLTGAHVIDARVQIDQQYNEPYVALTFDAVGARLFERITEENVQKRLAIILDGNVYSAPVIQEKISGGRAQITGRFTMEEAKDLSLVLRAGALPAPVKILEERSVGPSLGKDSIEAGIKATLIASIVVALFMMLYYKASGVIADLMLLLDLLFIMAGLAFFEATLTLPGIAGIALTLGMAVDANILIYERIREEQRGGKTTLAAIESGFSKATVTILDANITTLIVALVLFQFGSGPVRGFAVTLSLGIIASVFTAVFISRIIFRLMYGTMRMKKLSI